MQELTARQAQILDWIREYLRKQGVAPSITELQVKMGASSPTGVVRHLDALEKKGYIHRPRNTARSIRLLEGASDAIPVIGRVAAGSPIEAVENVERYLDIPDDLFSIKPDYLLKVVGDSMIKVGIFEDDYVGVKKQAQAENHQIVVARLGEEVTIKRLNITRGKITLLPENDAYEPIVPDPEDFALEGIYTGLVRPQ